MPAPTIAFDRFLPAGLERESRRSAVAGRATRLPSIYLSHGAPPLFDDAGWMDELFAWSTSMPKPTGIVIVSAHWETAPITITTPDPRTRLVYDFGGFDPRYYTMEYATPDSSASAPRRLRLSDIGQVVNRPRGLDHGAWVPLKVMYPRPTYPWCS